MTEAEAWRELADDCRPGGQVVAYVLGLCWGATWGARLYMATHAMKSRVRRRLKKKRPKRADVYYYYWPRTPAGYRARVRFCLRMARQCEAEYAARRRARARR